MIASMPPPRSFAGAARPEIARSASARPAQNGATMMGLSGQSLKPLQAKETIKVFIFLTHDCPIANAYAPEIHRIEALYTNASVRFYEVYSEKGLTAAEARTHHRSYRLLGTGLLDPGGKLAQQLHATISPEAAVVTGNSATLIYHGRIDNTYSSPGVRRQVTTTHELRDVIGSLVNHHPKQAPTSKPAVGCILSD